MSSKYFNSGRRAAAWRAAIGTTVLGAAAVVLAASASGQLRAHDADAATPPATNAPAASVPAVLSSTLAAPRHRSATVLTHLPSNVADPTRGVAIRLNGAPRLHTPRPKLTPATAGTWTDLGNYEFFRPVSTLEPCTKYTMVVPAGTVAKAHRHLVASRTVSFDVACPGITAVQEALARLNYLPYTLHGFVGASSTAALTRTEAAKRAFDLPHGILKANVPDAPPLTMGQLDPATTGAMEVFEGDHNLPGGTTITPRLWAELMAEETLAKANPHPYTWVTVTKTLPETLEVHEGSKIALSTPANTGVPGADTSDGIFPIYVRYVATTMIGNNVDGSHYVDPGVPWVNYFNGGDAVHGYPRPGYGYPQSNGCVELPISTAETVYGMLAVGDLVIVS
jgi:lipoprotein-anchoring transpeptidase ErfK/SrfK